MRKCIEEFQLIHRIGRYMHLNKKACRQCLLVRWLIFRSRGELVFFLGLVPGDLQGWKNLCVQSKMREIVCMLNWHLSSCQVSIFLQYNNLLLNCETRYLKLINLELYQVIEPFWQGKMQCQFVKVVLIRAGVNLIFKILWKLIVDKKKEYLDLHYIITLFEKNTKTKERQLKKLQMSVRMQINLEVKDSAKPMSGYTKCVCLMRLFLLP